jgi:hypothetical protein
MPRQAFTSAQEAAAHALALVVCANGHVDERELAVLDGLHAFSRLGVSRARFAALARACVDEVGAGLADRNWLSLDDRVHLIEVLDAVGDEAQRLLVCRLAAAVITADGCVTPGERHVYDCTLAHWGIGQERVTQAILDDRKPGPALADPLGLQS